MKKPWRWVLGGVAVIGAGTAAVIILFQWNWLKPPLEARLSSLTGKQVHIDGDLQGTWGWVPDIIADRIRIEDSDFKTAPTVATIDRLDVALDLRKLLHGTIDFPKIAIARPVLTLQRTAAGKVNWDIANEASGPSSRSRMPIIESLRLDDGKITFRDLVKNVTIEATIVSVAANGGTGGTKLDLKGHGTYRKAPFSIKLSGGSLETLRESDKPYDLDLAAAVGNTKLTAVGTVADPFKMTGIDVKVTAQGDNAEELYPVFGIPAPPTPPYKLAGTLDRDGKSWLFKNFSGTVGKSDLQGSLRFEPDRPRLLVSGNLISKQLDFADLGLLVGAPGSTAGDRPVSDQQRKMAAAYAESNRVLPDAPLNLNEVRSVDADITFKGEHIQAQTLPLENVDLHLTIDDAKLSLAPLHVGVADGLVDATIVIDARNDPVATDYDVKFRRFQIQRFFERAGFPQGGNGFLDGRVRLTGLGNSVRQSLGHSSGEASAIVDNGTMSKLVSDLLGLDVARSLGLLITGNDEQIPLRCVVTDFQVQDGVMRPRVFLLDSTQTQVTGTGTISLADETLDLSVRGEPKHSTPLGLGGPIEVGGTFRHPDVGLGKEAIMRGGAAVALGALLTPLAAIIGFVDPGKDGDADCAALEREASDSVNAKAVQSGTSSPRSGTVTRRPDRRREK